MAQNRAVKSIFLKTVIVLVYILAILAAALLLLRIPKVRAYKLKFETFMNQFLSDQNPHSDDSAGLFVDCGSMDELINKVPFSFPVPHWIPEGYLLDYACYTKYTDDIYVIDYSFISDEAKSPISFMVQTDLSATLGLNVAVECEETVINDMTILITISNGYMAEYIDSQGFYIGFGTCEDKETLIKIIENMS